MGRQVIEIRLKQLFSNDSFSIPFMTKFFLYKYFHRQTDFIWNMNNTND